MPNKQMAHNHKAKVLWPLPKGKDPSRRQDQITYAHRPEPKSQFMTGPATI